MYVYVYACLCANAHTRAHIQIIIWIIGIYLPMINIEHYRFNIYFLKLVQESIM